jgi:hypothetical protein
MYNAANTCIIVCLILLFASFGTGFTSIITKKVPVALATGFLNLVMVVFLLFMCAIVYRIHTSMRREKHCFDIFVNFDIICKSRIIHYGYTFIILCLSSLFTIITAACWFNITKVQKLLYNNSYVSLFCMIQKPLLINLKIDYILIYKKIRKNKFF